MSSFESFRPTPARFWIRHRPRRWPGGGGPWTDLAHLGLGSERRGGDGLPELPDRVLDDVVYLPPVEAELEPARWALATGLERAGTPVLLQRRVEPDLKPAPSGSEIWDLLTTLLSGSLDLLGGVPAGATVLWPLIPGLTDDARMIDAGLERLQLAGAAVVQGLAVELSPAARRRLAGGADEETFDRLFHAERPSERAFSGAAARRGLAAFCPRPLPSGPPRLVMRRRCAGELHLAAELCHRLGRPEVETQRLLRAARWIDREDYDLTALVYEGNLDIVGWIDARGREVIEQVVGGGRSELVLDLLAEYCGATGSQAGG